MRLFFCYLLLVIYLAANVNAATCGDSNNDSHINVGDAVYLINYIFKGGSEPVLQAAADVNGDGDINVGDAVYLINYIFKSGPEPVCSAFYTSPGTTTVVQPDSSDVILSCDSAWNISLDASSAYAQAIKIGDVIVGQNDLTAPDGFLRIVTSKSIQGNEIILETEQGNIANAFESLYINETIQLRPSDVRREKMAPGTELLSDPEDETFHIPINKVLYDHDGNPGTTGDQIKLQGQYDVTVYLTAIVIQEWFQLRRAEISIQTIESANINLIAELEWDFLDEVEVEIARYYLGAIFPAPPAPLWITPTIVVKAHIDGSLSVTLETGITFEQQLTYGFGYANGSYYDISQSSRSFSYLPPQYTGELSIEPALSLNTSFLVYGVAGPYLGGKLGLNFEAVLNVAPCDIDLECAIDATLSVNAGAECPPLQLDYNTDFLLYTHPIWSQVFPIGGSGTIVINPNPDILNAPWAVSGACSFNDNGNADESLNNLYAGSYTLTWGNIPGWVKPSNSTQWLSDGQTLYFNGTYIQLTAPIVTTTSISNITSTTAQSGGTVTSDGGSLVTSRGICWSTNPTPTISDNHTVNGSGTGSFASSMTGLSPNVTYYVRAYATNAIGTGYGNTLSFSTPPPVVPPTVTTTAVTNITSSSAQSGGNVTADGGATVSARGVCWSTNPTPTIADYKTSDGSGLGSYVSSLSGLSSNTTYYVRAYATNSTGTGYGNILSFSTGDVPTVTTASVTDIERYTATSGGNVTAQGGSAVTAKGVCWSINPNPTIADYKTTNGSGLGAFTSYLTGLTANTTYYIRAYATNSNGTGYGNMLSFTTDPEPSLPIVITNPVTGITSTWATCGGNVTSDGGTSVTARGVCWSTNPSPTIANNKTIDGSGTGAFTSLMTGLMPQTTYYVRAYATNSAGTGYGNERDFNTGDTLNTVIDIDGNVYQTVTIGTQVWMAENLRVTHYRNGDAIPHISDSATWASGPAYGAYCVYNNDPNNVPTYGRLYNWYAGTDSRNIAPAGWHVPSSAEWLTLVNWLGGDEHAGGHLKEAGTLHWQSPNTGADNSSGFTALPGGCRDNTGGWGYHQLTTNCLFWSTSINSWPIAIGWMGEYNWAGFCQSWYWVATGYSIRCVKD